MPSSSLCSPVSLIKPLFIPSARLSAARWLLAALSLTTGVTVNAATDVATWTAATADLRVLKESGTKSETLLVSIGSLRESCQAATVPNKGAELKAELKVDATGKPLLLELQEIHLRRPDVFGYSVWVNGRQIYFRTYEELAAGPVSVWIRVPAELAPDGKVSLTLRNEGAAPFSVSKIWLYADFAALAQSEGTFQPLAVMETPALLLTTVGPKGGEVKADSRKKSLEAEAEAAPALARLFEGTGFATGIHTNISYANSSFTEVQKQIDRDLQRVLTYGFQHQISFNGTEWGHHPNGMDGLGGYFSDIRYSKVRYLPQIKDFRPMWPGTPGGVTWPTWNDPQLNRFLDYRLARAAAYYRQRRDFLLARGAELPPPIINLEWGLSVSDHNDTTIAAARRDGIEIKPGEKASEAGKKWTFDNLCRTTQRFAAAFVAGAGRDPTVIDRGVVRAPSAQLTDQVVFQTFADPIGPYEDDRWAGWQMAVGPLTWASGEFLPQLPAAYYDYIAARGLLTAPNMERMGLPTLDYFGLLYRRGFRQVTPINTRLGDGEKLLAETAGLETSPAEAAPHLDRRLLQMRFRKSEPLATNATLLRFENVEVTGDPGHGPYDRITLRDPALPGTLLFRVTNPFASAQPLQLGLIGSFANKPEATLQIAVGETPADLKPVATLTAASLSKMKYYNWRNTGEADLGEWARGRREFLLQLTFASKDVTLDRLYVSSAWPQRSGALVGDTFTAREQRTQRLWMQDRALFERTAAAGSRSEDAVITHTREKALWRSGYHSLQAAQSVNLPACFAVRGNAKLAPHPISVALPGPDDVALIELFSPSPEAALEFAFVVEKPLSADLEIALKPGSGPWRLTRVGENRYRVIPGSDPSGKVRISGDRLTVSLPLTPPALQKPLPSQLSGVVAQRRNDGLLIDTQHPDLWMDNPIFVPLSANATLSRQRVGDNTPPRSVRPEPKDHVDLTINASGQATRAAATFGQTQGRIKNFYPPRAKGETSNGVIELEDGQRFEFSNMWGATDLRVPPLKPFIRLNTPEQLTAALKPGLIVDITYTPALVSGRLPRINRIAPSAQSIAE